MTTLLGIDIGTQGVKAALFDESGACLADAVVPSKLRRPAPGLVEEDPEFQVASVCRAIKRCVKDSGVDPASVAAIGIDGQMAGVIGVGADGRAVTPYDSWLDTRCAPYIKGMEREAGDQIIRKTGGPASFNHGPKKLWWMHERPREYRRITAFVQPSAYAVMRLAGLSGADAYIDVTYLHFSGFADARRKRWDDELCERFCMDESKLPRIVEPHEPIGELSAASARRCGLRAGVPLIAGCGDTAASFLACGATRPGVCVDVAGTASVFAATVERFSPDTKSRVLSIGRSATPGLWHPYAYINGGGMNLEWFRTRVMTHNGHGSVSLDRLNELAGALKPAASDVMFVPHLAGRVSPAQPDLRGAWVGLRHDTDAAELFRASLEAVALEYRIYCQALRRLYPRAEVREMRVTGGGECSTVWNRLKADALGMPVRRIVGSHGAPMGVALLAGFGVGLLPSLPDAAKRWVKLGETTRPRKALADHYARRGEVYQKLLTQLDGAL